MVPCCGPRQRRTSMSHIYLPACAEWVAAGKAVPHQCWVSLSIAQRKTTFRLSALRSFFRFGNRLPAGTGALLQRDGTGDESLRHREGMVPQVTFSTLRRPRLDVTDLTRLGAVLDQPRYLLGTRCRRFKQMARLWAPPHKSSVPATQRLRRICEKLGRTCRRRERRASAT